MHAARILVVLALMASAVVSLRGAQGGFTATLSPDQQAAAGIAALTDAKRDLLNALIASEVALARQGEVSGFAGTFSSRRNDGERAAAGIEGMTAEQVAELDRLVAALIAAGPSTRDIPVKLKRDQTTKPRERLEVHGEISYTFGAASGGREFHGGSMTTTIFDTKTGSSLSFTYGQFEGDLLPYHGRYGYHDDWTGPPPRVHTGIGRETVRRPR